MRRFLGHRAHPRIQERGLADRCEACEELARNVRRIDDDVLREIIAFAGDPDWIPRSRVEAIAVANVQATVDQFAFLLSVDPERTLAYLRDRHGRPLMGAVR